MNISSNKLSQFPLLLFFFLIGTLLSCREDVAMFLAEEEQTNDHHSAEQFLGFYLLNEGNMGSNKSTLDFYDFESGVYRRNIYAEVNPTVPKELGDVGNDLGVYGSKLYAVINVSNKVEVMDAFNTKRITHIDIPNCRYVAFHEKYAYVTSYAGPVQINPNYTQRGFVAKIDTATLEVVAQCLVGFQPDELAIVNNKIYIANSGGYMGAGNTAGYERTISVIDIESFTETERIDVAYNLHHAKVDKYNQLWVSSRGDYYTIPSRLFCVDTKTNTVVDSVDVPVSNYWIDEDYIYAYAVSWSHLTAENSISYCKIDVRTREVVSHELITDGTDALIETPYGIMVDPQTKDIYITDAGNYVTTGVVYCFDKKGKKKWAQRAGNIPAHFALLSRKR